MSSASDKKSKKGPLFWVLVSGATFLVLLFGGLLIVAYSAKWEYQRRMAAGQGNDVLRTACLGSDSSNEVVDEDAAGSTVHFRNKKTGKEFHCYLDPATKQMRIVPFELGEPREGK